MPPESDTEIDDLTTPNVPPPPPSPDADEKAEPSEGEADRESIDAYLSTLSEADKAYLRKCLMAQEGDRKMTMDDFMPHE